MAHACTPSTFGRLRQVHHLRSGVQDHPGQHGETLSLLKIQKISWAWWHVPVIPATQEAEGGEELPEPRRQKLLWAEIAPLHSSLGNKSETPSQKKKIFFKSIRKWYFSLKEYSIKEDSKIKKSRKCLNAVFLKLTASFVHAVVGGWHEKHG